MDLRQLEAFAAVMSAGSVTGAGQMLGRSQPAVSRSIQELEQALGFALFERSGPKVTPTHRAFSLYAEVEGALASVRAIKQRAVAISDAHNHHLRIAATSALATGLVPAALARLPASLQPRQLQLQSLAPEKAIEAVLAHTVDLGVVSLPLEHRGLTVHWIGEAPCVAVLPAASPLASEPQLALGQLASQVLITIANPYRFRRRINKAFEDEHLEPAHILETNTSLNAMQMARVGLGIALVDPVTAYGVPLEGVVVRPVELNIPFFFGVISPHASPLSDVAQALLGCLAETAQHLPGMCKHRAADHDALLQRVYASQGDA